MLRKGKSLRLILKKSPEKVDVITLMPAVGKQSLLIIHSKVIMVKMTSESWASLLIHYIILVLYEISQNAFLGWPPLSLSTISKNLFLSPFSSPSLPKTIFFSHKKNLFSYLHATMLSSVWISCFYEYKTNPPLPTCALTCNYFPIAQFSSNTANNWFNIRWQENHRCAFLVDKNTPWNFQLVYPNSVKTDIAGVDQRMGQD